MSDALDLVLVMGYLFGVVVVFSLAVLILGVAARSIPLGDSNLLQRVIDVLGLSPDSDQ
jgi:hypothetical protein